MRASIAALLMLAAFAPSARAASTSAAIATSFSPDRLNGRSALTFTVEFSGGQFGVPAPIRRAVLQFPAGLSLEIPLLRSCSPARLRARGPSGCPAQSRLGSGHALAQALAGSQLIDENITLSAFLGPPRNLQPTVEILAQGYTPFDERVVLSAEVMPDSGLYSEELVMHIPAIATVPLEPDASIVSFSLTVGAHGPRGAHTDAVVVPSSCPAKGFPFAAEFSYADGSSGAAHTTAPCP